MVLFLRCDNYECLVRICGQLVNAFYCDALFIMSIAGGFFRRGICKISYLPRIIGNLDVCFQINNVIQHARPDVHVAVYDHILVFL